MKPKQEAFYHTYSKKEDFGNFRTITIYQCQDDNPPSRLTTNVDKLCNIKFDFNVPYDMLQDFLGANGKTLKILNYEIEMIPSGASNLFSVFYQGEKLGSENARIDFQ